MKFNNPKANPINSSNGKYLHIFKSTKHTTNRKQTFFSNTLWGTRINKPL